MASLTSLGSCSSFVWSPKTLPMDKRDDVIVVGWRSCWNAVALFVQKVSAAIENRTPTTGILFRLKLLLSMWHQVRHCLFSRVDTYDRHHSSSFFVFYFYLYLDQSQSQINMVMVGWLVVLKSKKQKKKTWGDGRPTRLLLY